LDVLQRNRSYADKAIRCIGRNFRKTFIDLARQRSSVIWLGPVKKLGWSGADGLMSTPIRFMSLIAFELVMRQQFHVARRGLVGTPAWRV